MPTEKCECRFSRVVEMTRAERTRYVDKTKCEDCGKVKRIPLPTFDETAEEAAAEAAAAENAAELAEELATVE